MTTDPSDIAAVALLDEPVRRALYEAVLRAGRPIGRDEAAVAAGTSRALAAFHLDRLASGGLLDAEYRRLSGRTGPGAGRPAKLYRRAEREIAVGLPERRYDVPAALLSETLERLAGPEPGDVLRSAAEDRGRQLGSAARATAGSRPGRQRLRSALVETLAEQGYEPLDRDGEIRLGNCPYHGLVDDHRELVCGMNLALADGVLDGLGDPRLGARLDPRPGQCCVAIGPQSPA